MPSKYTVGYVEHDDKCVVVTIDKNVTSSYKTYINNRPVSIQQAYNRNNNAENRVDMAGVAINGSDVVISTLTVFGYAECGKVEAFANAMRKSHTSEFQAHNDEVQAVKDRDRNLSSTDGADSANTSLDRSGKPQDADLVKFSSITAWTIAIELENPTFKATAQQLHDRLMREWVVERGYNVPLSAYDYFAHSHGVAWPTTLKNATAGGLVKIEERHAQLLKNF
ncbi:hypothetical protein GALMADRAFT_256065 [Galerina marginata CBS 339.88]|uniref:Uncharacterized protein n=1 Tax=Galerina marginata (strain CBS 339.88) TaxID=685588 RepID=A0A067SGS7_GALM3|nr:hypothetical protein GALMADRAFT_256065 [Galerina marginata CBS 339.88]